MSQIFRNCGTSRYNAQYYCDVTMVEFTNTDCTVHIEVRGDGSLGSLQNPEASRLFVGSNLTSIPHRTFVGSVRTANFIKGVFVYDSYHCIPGRTLYFQFGSEGYSKIQIVNAMPNLQLNLVNSPGFSMNIGNFGISVGLNNSNNMTQQQNYVPPQTSYTYSQTSQTTSYTPPYTGNTGYQGNNTGYQSYGGNTGYQPYNNNNQNFRGLNIQRGQSIGNRHNDTRSFDHFSYIPNNTPWPIRQVKIFGSTYANGIQVSYEMRGPTPIEMGNNDNPYEQVLNLDTGEYITEISGRSGNIIDRLEIRTNLGKFIAVGGNGGSPFRFTLPYGSQVVGFYGGVGGHLHNIGVYTA